MIRLTGSRSRIVYRELPQDDPLQRCPDITLARRTLDWEPRVALDDGLARTIAYFERMLVERGEKQGLQPIEPVRFTARNLCPAVPNHRFAACNALSSRSGQVGRSASR